MENLNSLTLHRSLHSFRRKEHVPGMVESDVLDRRKLGVQAAPEG